MPVKGLIVKAAKKRPYLKRERRGGSKKTGERPPQKGEKGGRGSKYLSFVRVTLYGRVGGATDGTGLRAAGRKTDHKRGEQGATRKKKKIKHYAHGHKATSRQGGE